MRVSFAIDVMEAGLPVTIPEDTLLADPASYRDRILDPEAVDGSVVIEVPSAQTRTRFDRFEVRDTLSAAIHNLSFAGVAAVLGHPDRPYVYTFSSADHHVIMLPLADLVRLFGEGEEAVTAEAALLLPELYRCGERFLAFLARLGDRATHLAAYMQPDADRARRILEEHGLI